MMRTNPIMGGTSWLVGALAWMGVIYLFFGRERFGSHHTAPFLHALLAAVAPGWAAGLTPDQVLLIDFVVRKTFHVLGYAVLAALLGGGLRRAGLRPPLAAALTLVIIIGFAALDEWHQGQISGRQAAPRDVAIDAAGAALGLAWVLAWVRRRNRIL